MIYDVYDVVRVPFPFTERRASKRRPALVLSSATRFNSPAGHSVMAMITSARQRAWPLDCSVNNLEAAGLPAPSVVRFKLFTLDHRLISDVLGRLDAEDIQRVSAKVRLLLGERSAE